MVKSTCPEGGLAGSWGGRKLGTLVEESKYEESICIGILYDCNSIINKFLIHGDSIKKEKEREKEVEGKSRGRKKMKIEEKKKEWIKGRKEEYISRKGLFWKNSISPVVIAELHFQNAFLPLR